MSKFDRGILREVLGLKLNECQFSTENYSKVALLTFGNSGRVHQKWRQFYLLSLEWVSKLPPGDVVEIVFHVKWNQHNAS